MTTKPGIHMNCGMAWSDGPRSYAGETEPPFHAEPIEPVSEPGVAGNLWYGILSVVGLDLILATAMLEIFKQPLVQHLLHVMRVNP